LLGGSEAVSSDADCSRFQMSSWCMDLALDHEVDGVFVEQMKRIVEPPLLFVLESERRMFCGLLVEGRGREKGAALLLEVAPG